MRTQKPRSSFPERCPGRVGSPSSTIWRMDLDVRTGLRYHTCMATMLLEAPPLPTVEPGLGALVAEAAECLERAGGARLDGVDDDALGAAIAGLSVLESRAAALRL